MRNKMLGAAIAASLSVVSLGAWAQASRASDDAGQLAQLQVQLAALQAKVAQLEQQQDQQQTHQQQLAGQQPAQPPAPRAAGGALAEWADSTKISGTSFLDFTNIDQTSNGSKTAASGTGLDVKRFYLSIDHKFNDIWSVNLTTDFNYTSVTGETQLFVKKAYLQGAFGKLAILRVGSANLPWIPFVEDWYGYRFVENTLIDRLKFGTSADWGLHLLGDNGMFDYQVSAINGAGYKNPSRSNSVDVEGRVGFHPIKRLVFAVGGYSGDLGKDTATSPALHDAHRYDALAAYAANGLRLGAEYFRASNWNNVTTPLGDAADGWSLWGSYDFGPASVFARYDRANPGRDLNPNLTDTYYNAGVAFPVTQGVRVAIAYKNEKLTDNAAIDTRSREIGAWAEVKW